MEIEKILQIANNEVGYLEKASNSDLDDKTANAGKNNYTKYTRDMDALNVYNTKKQGYPWCNIFVDWCFVQALGVDRARELLIGFSAGCTQDYNWFKQKRQIVDTPQRGDLVFFGKTSHVGIIEEVKDGKIYTIEGNTSNEAELVENGGAVVRKSYALNSTYIHSYARPKYDEVVEQPIKPDTIVLEWQKAMNASYNCGLAEDNKFGPDSTTKATKYQLYYISGKAKFKNEHVKFIQERLCIKGFNTAIDGSFGPDASNKTKSFQKAHNLKVDGYVGINTTKALLK